MPLKRCNFYDDAGNARRSTDGTLGCRKYAMGHCRFIHPDEDAWERASYSEPPPLSFLHKEDRYSSLVGRHSSNIRNRRSESPSSEIHSSTRPPPTGPRRRTTTHSDMSPPRRHSVNHSRRSRSPTGSTSSRDPGPSRRPTDPSRIPLGPSRRDENMPIEPLVAPPPLPPPPSIATGDKPPPDPITNKELPAPEKREVWLERIKLISESAKHRTELVTFESELRSKRGFKQSAKFDDLSEGDKSLLTTGISDLEKECEGKKQELNVTIAKLMETNYWPVLQAPDMNGAEQKYQDLKHVVTDLKDAVTKINGDLQLIVTELNLDRTSGVQSEQAMDVDRRPSKRRRVDEDEEIGIFQGRGQGYTAEEFENIRDSVVSLERRLSDLQNDLTQRDADVMDEIIEAIDAKWEDAGPPPISIHGPQNDAGVEDSGKLQVVEDNLNATGADVGALAEEIGKLMTREPELAAEIQQLKEENTRIRDSCAAYETSFQQLKEQMERDKKAAEALSAALAAHIAHPPSPPPSPAAIPQEYILQILDEPIQDSVREHIKQLLDGLRTDVKNMMRTKNDELCGALGGKLTLTLKMVDAIARKVNQESGDAPP